MEIKQIFECARKVYELHYALEKLYVDMKCENKINKSMKN